MSGNTNPPVITSAQQVEQLLGKALMIIELTIDLKEKSHIGEKYACDLKSLAWKARQITSAINTSTRDFLQVAEHILRTALDIISADMNNDAQKASTDEHEKDLQTVKDENSRKDLQPVKTTEDMDLVYKELINLQSILKKDIQKPLEVRLFKTKSSTNVSDMIKTLQSKQLKRRESTSSTRIYVDEKYPEKTSKESLLDQAHLSLQTVHEDGFTDFNSFSPEAQRRERPMRSIQRMKRILRQDGAETEDLNTRSSFDLIRSYSMNSMGKDSDTVLRNNTSIGNILLQNISEED